MHASSTLEAADKDMKGLFGGRPGLFRVPFSFSLGQGTIALHAKPGARFSVLLVSATPVLLPAFRFSSFLPTFLLSEGRFNTDRPTSVQMS